jgi:hypothetical protein
MLIYGSQKEGASSGRPRESGNSCTGSEQMTRRMLAWLGFTLLGIALVQPAAAQKKAPEAALAQAEISG